MKDDLILENQVSLSFIQALFHSFPWPAEREDSLCAGPSAGMQEQQQQKALVLKIS